MARGKLVLTYQDYLQMPDDRNRREILGGDLYVTPAPSPLHQRVLANLAEVLNQWVRARAIGKVFPSPIDVVLSQVDVVQPDLAYVSADRLQIVTGTGIQGAPDLVIEVLSRSTARLDRGHKMETYARFGVQEYWADRPRRPCSGTAHPREPGLSARRPSHGEPVTHLCAPRGSDR